MVLNNGLDIEAHLDSLLAGYEQAEMPQLPVASKVKISRAKIKSGGTEVELENAVEIDPVVMARMQRRIDKYSSAFADKLFKDMLPLLISYSCGINYVQAAAREGLGLELEFDQGVLDMIKQVGALNVAYHFVRNSKVPRSIRKRFMEKFTDSLALRSAEQLFMGQSAKRRMMQELQAMVGTKSDGKITAYKQNPDAAKTSGIGSMKRQR